MSQGPSPTPTNIIDRGNLLQQNKHIRPKKKLKSQKKKIIGVK
jgi:hypothetical protein